MKVRDLMVRTPANCPVTANLGEVVDILWKRNCGMLPIVDKEERVIGVITDRDICIALGTRNILPGEIGVGDVMAGKLFVCRPEDDLRSALMTMARNQVRRLPVVNIDGRLEGVLSMDDVILHAEHITPGKRPELTCDEVVDALKNVYWPHLPELAHKRAEVA